MINLNQFPFYNYCFDEERLENLYKNFNENKGEYTNGVKTLIQLRFISFCSDSKATFLKIDTPKNANFFFQELLDELDKSIEICEKAVEYYSELGMHTESSEFEKRKEKLLKKIK